MNIDSIKNGIVIDHITAGKGMEIYNFLKLDGIGCPVAMIMNVNSKKMGKKDIIKVDAEVDLNLDSVGYIDAGVTINYIKDGKLVKKNHLELPETIKGIIRCKNPRCITSVEQEIEHIFKLTDKEKGVYRCIYCESKAREND